MLTYMNCDTTCRTIRSLHVLLSDLTRPHAFVSSIPESSAVSSPSIDSSRGAPTSTAIIPPQPPSSASAPTAPA